MLLCGAGCCLWACRFSGRSAQPWGRAAPWAAREPSAPRAVRTASFDRCVGSLSGTLQTWLTNLACNSLATISSSEFITLKSRRF